MERAPVRTGRQVDGKLAFDGEESSRRIGPRFAPALMKLPEALVGPTPLSEFRFLASTDLYRGHSVRSPAGEAVTRVPGFEPCTPAELKIPKTTWSETPFGLYVLAETEGSYKSVNAIASRKKPQACVQARRNFPASAIPQTIGPLRSATNAGMARGLGLRNA
jgi:hypothetical protein